jgi:hypothetical protein
MKTNNPLSRVLDVSAKMSIFLLTLFMSTQSLLAADILMGQYDFTTGADQLKPSSVTQGITMGDIVVGTGSTPITSNFIGDAIETSNWGSSMGISNGKCINLSITKGSNASEFNVSKLIIALKRTTAAKFQINYGAAANTSAFRTYAAVTLHGTNFYTPAITFTENTNTGNTGTSVSLLPAVITTTPQFIAIGTMFVSPSTASEVVYIDKIEVWGTVTTTPAAPTITSITPGDGQLFCCIYCSC